MKRLELRERVKAFFPQGQSKLSVIMRCPYQAGVRMQGLTAVDVNLVNMFYDTAHINY